jgi:FkbM family methyltransferase
MYVMPRATAPELKLVVCCGMIRSGSTLQYQLACEILSTIGPVRKLGYIAPGEALPADWDASAGVAICKLHHHDKDIGVLLKEGRAAGFYCFRDLRDVAKSCMRQFALQFEQLWEQNWLGGAIADGDRWLSFPNLYSTKYEYLVENQEHEVRRMADWLNIPLTGELTLAVAQKYSRNAQRKRLAEIVVDPRRGYDAETLLHANHLQDPEDPSEAKPLTAAQAALIWDRFQDWLTLRGYRLSSNESGRNGSPANQALTESGDETFVAHCGWLLHPKGDEVARLLREGHYEADLQAFFWLYLRPGDNFLDVGAHCGLYSCLAARLTAPGGQTLTVEPNVSILPFLKENLDPSTQLVPVALGRAEGSGKLALGSDGYTAHSYLTAGVTDEMTIPVPVDTLEAVLRRKNWSKTQLVKIDTEGREFDVLEGAAELLGTAALPVLSLEFSENNLLSFGRTTRQLAQFLQRRGYQVCRFDVELLQLVPVSDEVWPSWYSNLLAVIDLNTVNTLLQTATAERQRIARDILARAAASSKLRDLAELDTYRKRAAQADSFREWAEQTEALLSEERASKAAQIRELESALRAAESRIKEHGDWAIRTECLLREERQASQSHKAWAEKNETLLQSTRKEAADFKAWAEKNEMLLKMRCKEATDFKAWAEKNEVLLQLARKEAADFKAWAEKSEILLQSARKEAADFKAWAEKTEDLLKLARGEAAGHLAWAQQTERLLAEARAACDHPSHSSNQNGE